MVSAPTAPERPTEPVCHKFKLHRPMMREFPDGAVVYATGLALEGLTFGDLILVLLDAQPQVARFLERRGDYLLVSLAGRRLLRANDLVGRVTQLEHQGRHFNPERQGPLTRLFNRLTGYGTLFQASQVARRTP